jgi:hypothetical protein
MAGSRSAPRVHGDWRSARSTAGAISETVSALRRGREAVEEIDGQLDEVLDWVKDPRGKKLSRDLPERMKQSSTRAAAALLNLGGPAGNELY